MNMGPKGPHIPFGESDIGQSIVEGPESLVAGNYRNTANLNNGPGRVSKQIPEVVFQ